MEPSTSNKARQETDFKLCIQCQEPDTSQEPEVVTEPSQEAYAKFLQYVHQRCWVPTDQHTTPRAHCQWLERQKSKVAPEVLWLNLSLWLPGTARVRHQKACEQGENQHLQQRRGRPSASASVSDSSAQSNTPRVTRSSTTPFNARLCFFLPGGQERCSPWSVHIQMGEKLQKAVEASNNQTWKVQLSSAISGDDAHAVDVKYHLPCWVKNVQRGATREGEGAGTERN